MEAGNFWNRYGLAVRSNFRLLPHPILTELETLASKTAAENGFDLSSVLLLTHQIPMTMQVQVRHMGGGDVSLDDCACLSKTMGEAIENSQLISEPYVLEISSPGISDQLLTDRDFQTFRGFPIEVIIKDENNSELRRTGLLKERSKAHLHLNIKGKMNRIPRETVLGVRLTSTTS